MKFNYDLHVYIKTVFFECQISETKNVFDRSLGVPHQTYILHESLDFFILRNHNFVLIFFCKKKSVPILFFLTGGRTRIDLGIDESTLILYNQRFNENVLHKKLLIVLSDGKQSLINRKIPNLKKKTGYVLLKPVDKVITTV